MVCHSLVKQEPAPQTAGSGACHLAFQPCVQAGVPTRWGDSNRILASQRCGEPGVASGRFQEDSSPGGGGPRCGRPAGTGACHLLFRSCLNAGNPTRWGPSYSKLAREACLKACKREAKRERERERGRGQLTRWWGSTLWLTSRECAALPGWLLKSPATSMGMSALAAIFSRPLSSVCTWAPQAGSKCAHKALDKILHAPCLTPAGPSPHHRAPQTRQDKDHTSSSQPDAVSDPNPTRPSLAHA